MDLYKCNTCRGTGQRYVYHKGNIKTTYRVMACVFCSETGYVDWIDNITRNKDNGFFVEDLFGFSKIMLPILSRSYPQLVASELVSVQPQVKGL